MLASVSSRSQLVTVPAQREASADVRDFSRRSL